MQVGPAVSIDAPDLRTRLSIRMPDLKLMLDGGEVPDYYCGMTMMYLCNRHMCLWLEKIKIHMELRNRCM